VKETQPNQGKETQPSKSEKFEINLKFSESKKQIHKRKNRMPNYCYLRFNANGETPMEFVNLADSVPKDKVWDELKKTMSHKGTIYFHPVKYTLWCSDGKRYKVEILYDDDGLNKKLQPNHRFNAMVNLGRFTTKSFDYIGQSRQQDIKETWGSNYFVGDVIVKVVEGKPIPDCSIFGENPIKSIFTQYIPNTRMINKYGREKAIMMFSPIHKKVMPTGMVSADSWENAPWEVKDYHIFHPESLDDEYIELLKGWGFDPNPMMSESETDTDDSDSE